MDDTWWPGNEIRILFGEILFYWDKFEPDDLDPEVLSQALWTG